MCSAVEESHGPTFLHNKANENRKGTLVVTSTCLTFSLSTNFHFFLNLFLYRFSLYCLRTLNQSSLAENLFFRRGAAAQVHELCRLQVYIWCLCGQYQGRRWLSKEAKVQGGNITRLLHLPSGWKCVGIPTNIMQIQSLNIQPPSRGFAELC